MRSAFRVVVVAFLIMATLFATTLLVAAAGSSHSPLAIVPASGLHTGRPTCLSGFGPGDGDGGGG